MNKREDINEKLNEQLGFLKDDCEKFDQGEEQYAINIAGNLRTLLHDSQSINTPMWV